MGGQQWGSLREWGLPLRQKRLREIDRRIRFLTKRLEIAEIVEPAIHHGSDQVFFGATVTYLEDDSVERTITILGIDEAESGHGQVSWMSPVARALLKSRWVTKFHWLPLEVCIGWR